MGKRREIRLAAQELINEIEAHDTAGGDYGFFELQSTQEEDERTMVEIHWGQLRLKLRALQQALKPVAVTVPEEDEDEDA